MKDKCLLCELNNCLSTCLRCKHFYENKNELEDLYRASYSSLEEDKEKSNG